MLFKLRLLTCTLMVVHSLHAQDVRIGVLGLFHPHQLTLKAAPGQAFVIQVGKESFVLERSSLKDTASITSSGNDLILEVGHQTLRAPAIRVASRSGGATDLVLAIPGKISRQYHGVLEVKAVSGILVPAVGMDMETAVASAVQAESDPNAPLEALKAQSVATRSYSWPRENAIMISISATPPTVSFCASHLLPTATLLVPPLLREVWCWLIASIPWPQCLPVAVADARGPRKK